MKHTSSVESTTVTRACNMVPVIQRCHRHQNVMFTFTIRGILCLLYLGVKIDELLTPTLYMHKNLTISQVII